MNEEAIFILEGEGTLRLGEGSYPVRKGDYIALVTGLANAHQLINTGTATLRYLCLSTRKSPEIAVWPDTNRIGVLGGEAANIREFYDRKDAISGAAASAFSGEKPDDA